MDAAVVGPDTRCQDEPKSAAITAGIMPAYRPYSGGMPAMVAKATPWGRTTMAPVSPATKSYLRVPRPTSGHHSRNGRKRLTAAGITCVWADMGALRSESKVAPMLAATR